MKTLAKIHPELISEWSGKNGDLSPDKVSYGSNRIVWWNGKCGHEWKASIKNRSNGSGCPVCSGNQVLHGVNDLGSCRPEVAAEWSEKNYPMMPSDVTIRANKKVWWKCASCGYEWQARVADRTEGHGCPVCAGAIILAGHNDLATLYPELMDEWGEENNDSPSDYSPKSRKKVWWNCQECGFHWEAVINTRVKGQECPVCRHTRELHERKLAMYDERLMIELIKGFAEEKNLKITFNDEADIGVPLAVFFPEEHVAIEFTDKKQNHGPLRRWENAKNWLCVNAGIRMIRILSPDAKAYKNCECIRREGAGHLEGCRAITKAMESI